jgi:hypothetical protein
MKVGLLRNDMYPFELQTNNDSGSAALFKFLDGELDDFLDFHDLLLVMNRMNFELHVNQFPNRNFQTHRMPCIAPSFL